MKLKVGDKWVDLEVTPIAIVIETEADREFFRAIPLTSSMLVAIPDSMSEEERDKFVDMREGQTFSQFDPKKEWET